jgi:hypothetical protein
MKTKTIIYLIMFLLIAPLTQGFASKGEYSKTVRKGWLKGGITALQVSNKFGEVRLNNSGGDSITIRVKITVDNASESRAKSLLDKIKIEIEKTGGLISAQTVIEENFINNPSFSIDYLVNIPKDRDLDITNKYGNVVVSDLEAKGRFDVSYGNFTAGQLKAPESNPIFLSVAYGKADIDKVNSAELSIRYSKLFATEIGTTKLDTKYSTFNIGKIGGASIESKYDTYNIEEIGRMNAESKYSSYKIGLLTDLLNIDTGYGSVRIEKVGPKFQEITVTNSYGGISIGLGELSYKLKADCNYCDVAYPANRFKGNKSRESNNVSIDGNVGSGGGKVSITSRYGGVKLFD